MSILARTGAFILLLCSGCFAAWPQPASSPGPNPPGPASTPDRVVRRVPPPPGTGTPADTFRELLQMTPEARAEALADRTEHQRKYLEGRLREYEALPLAEREARLKQLELTCHLGDLMKLKPEMRAARLELVSPVLRPLIEERLKQWDRLPPKVQQDTLQHETTANYFFRVGPEENATSGLAPGGGNPPGSEAESGKWARHLNQFLGLPAKEREETLKVLTPTEREEMEGALKAFAQLPPEQRKICLDSFERFHRMSKEQRDQFLENAARWKAMSPRERATWRSLVEILPAIPTPSRAPSIPGRRASEGGAVTASNVSGGVGAGR